MVSGIGMMNNKAAETPIFLVDPVDVVRLQM
jgi:hypothetical protein